MHGGTLKVYLCPHSLTSRTCASFSSRVGRVVHTKWTTSLSCKGRVAHAFSAAVICSRHQKTLAASPGVRGDTHRRQYALQLPGHGQTVGRLRVAPSGRGVNSSRGGIQNCTDYVADTEGAATHSCRRFFGGRCSVEGSSGPSKGDPRGRPRLLGVARDPVASMGMLRVARRPLHGEK